MPPPKKGETTEKTRKSAERAYARGHGAPAKRRPSAKRSRAIEHALQREDRAAVAGKLYFQFEPNSVTDPPSLEQAAQDFVNALYEQRIQRGDPPRESPELYAMHARASRKTWPVYFLAIGMELDLPAEAFYGKVGLPPQ